MTRTLVAGFGNVLRGDDGFGVHVINRLEEQGIASNDVVLLEVGTGGIRLAQELLSPYDQVIVIDAVSRGQAPGTVSVRVVDQVSAATEIDMHAAIPARALSVAQALGGLPARVFLIGCEPRMETLDELTMGLSAEVLAGVTTAIAHVRALVDGSAEIARRDEVLELLYWLEGESLVGSATLQTMSRFMACEEQEVFVTLTALVSRGDVHFVDASSEYKLTEIGRREAGRRFAEEFATLLSQGHGECNDPTCDCHDNPAGAAECHAAKSLGHKH